MNAWFFYSTVLLGPENALPEKANLCIRKKTVQRDVQQPEFGLRQQPLALPMAYLSGHGLKPGAWHPF